MEYVFILVVLVVWKRKEIRDFCLESVNLLASQPQVQTLVVSIVVLLSRQASFNQRVKGGVVEFEYKKNNQAVSLFVPYNMKQRKNLKVELIKDDVVIKEFVHPAGLEFLCTPEQMKCDSIRKTEM